MKHCKAILTILIIGITFMCIGINANAKRPNSQYGDWDWYSLNCFENPNCSCGGTHSQCSIGNNCNDGCPGHNWYYDYSTQSGTGGISYTSYVAPTCTQYGSYSGYQSSSILLRCHNCSSTKWVSETQYVSGLIEPLGHIWKWIDLNCQGHDLTYDTGMHQQECQRSGCNATQNYEHHTYNQTNDGYMTCYKCGHKYQVCYNIIFDYNLGDNLEGIDKYDKVKFFDTIPLPTTQREGYTFKGWQCYSGATKYSNNTNTDPLTNNNSTYLTGGVQGLCYNQNGTVTLVAIWEHEHSDVDLKINIGTGSLNSNYYYHTTDTSKFVIAPDGYYINTNIYNEIPFSIKASCSNVGNYYKIISYGLKAEDNITADNDTMNEFTNDFLATKNVYIEHNNYGTVRGHCETECTWHDAHSICSGNINAYIETEKLGIIGDEDKPQIHNLDIFEQLEGIDKTEVEHLYATLFATDDISGLRPISNIYILNEDNGLTTGISNSIYPTTWTTEHLVYSKLEKTEIDLMDKDILINNLFNGKVVANHYLIDNVGNENINSEDISIFDMNIALESYTNNPSDRYIPDNPESALAVVKGEACKLTVQTTGYANAIRVQFPSDWYIDEEYPIYVYWGSDPYDRSKLIPITKDYFYINPNNDPDGNWVQDIIFITPLYCESGRCFDTIKVVGYKGDVELISNYQIRINQNATMTIEELSRSKDMYIKDASIKDGVHTTIKNTYRANKTR